MASFTDVDKTAFRRYESETASDNVARWMLHTPYTFRCRIDNRDVAVTVPAGYILDFRMIPEGYQSLLGYSSAHPHIGALIQYLHEVGEVTFNNLLFRCSMTQRRQITEKAVLSTFSNKMAFLMSNMISDFIEEKLGVKNHKERITYGQQALRNLKLLLTTQG